MGDVRELRNFGLIMGAMLCAMFGLAIPWIWELRFPLWPWVAAAVFITAGVLWPTSLAPVHRTWMRIARALGWLNTRILLGAIFFLFLAPLGLIMRFAGRDPLARRRDTRLESYRVPAKPSSPTDLERPF